MGVGGIKKRMTDIYIKCFVFLRKRESGGGAEREGEDLKRVLHNSSEPDVGLELTNCEMVT